MMEGPREMKSWLYSLPIEILEIIFQDADESILALSCVCRLFRTLAWPRMFEDVNIPFDKCIQEEIPAEKKRISWGRDLLRKLLGFRRSKSSALVEGCYKSIVPAQFQRSRVLAKALNDRRYHDALSRAKSLRLILPAESNINSSGARPWPQVGDFNFFVLNLAGPLLAATSRLRRLSISIFFGDGADGGPNVEALVDAVAALPRELESLDVACWGLLKGMLSVDAIRHLGKLKSLTSLSLANLPYRYFRQPGRVDVEGEIGNLIACSPRLEELILLDRGMMYDEVIKSVPRIYDEETGTERAISIRKLRAPLLHHGLPQTPEALRRLPLIEEVVIGGDCQRAPMPERYEQLWKGLLAADVKPRLVQTQNLHPALFSWLTSIGDAMRDLNLYIHWSTLNQQENVEVMSCNFWQETLPAVSSGLEKLTLTVGPSFLPTISAYPRLFDVPNTEFLKWWDMQMLPDELVLPKLESANLVTMQTSGSTMFQAVGGFVRRCPRLRHLELCVVMPHDDSALSISSIEENFGADRSAHGVHDEVVVDVMIPLRSRNRKGLPPAPTQYRASFISRAGFWQVLREGEFLLPRDDSS